MRTRHRRGANAVEFALVSPLLLLLVAGVIDLGELLYLTDAAVTAVAEAGRAGALADPGDGEDPIATARAAGDRWWFETEHDAPFVVDARITGTAGDRRLVVSGTVAFDPTFGVIALPASIEAEHTIRLFHQPP